MSHEDFIMQTRWQVSSAPVRWGSRAGAECLTPESCPRLAPTRAGAASSSHPLSGRSQGPRCPGKEERVFLHSPDARAQVPLPRSYTRRRAIRSGAEAGEHPQPGTFVRGCWPNAKLKVPRERKRPLRE